MGAFDAKVSSINGSGKTETNTGNKPGTENSGKTSTESAGGLDQSFAGLQASLSTYTQDLVNLKKTNPQQAADKNKDYYDCTEPVAGSGSKQMADARLGQGAQNPAIAKDKTAQMVGNGQLPNTCLDERAVAKINLQNDHVSANEKLRQVDLLGRMGETHVDLVDGTTTRRCRIELEKMGNRTLVHLFANDENGKEHVILRGIRGVNDDGNYDHQRDKSGKEVSYIGTWWNSKIPNSKLDGNEG